MASVILEEPTISLLQFPPAELLAAAGIDAGHIVKAVKSLL